MARRCASTRDASCSARVAPADFWWVLLDGRLDLVPPSGYEESVVAVISARKYGRRLPGLDRRKPGYLATGRAITAGRILRIPARAAG